MTRSLFGLLEAQRERALSLLGDKVSRKFATIIRLGWWDDIFREAAKHQPRQVLKFIVQANEPEWAYRALRSSIRFGTRQVSTLVAVAAQDPMWAHWVLSAPSTYKKLSRSDVEALTQSVSASGTWTYRTLERMPRGKPTRSIKKDLIVSVARDRKWRGRARKNKHLTGKLLTPGQKKLLFERHTKK